MCEIYETQCCGVKEIDGIMEHKNPENIIKHTIENIFDFYDSPKIQCAFITFSGVIGKKRKSKNPKNTIGNRLLKYIKQHNLGNVKASITKRNPNSNNLIKLYMWEIKSKNMKSWYINNFPKEWKRLKEYNT